MIKSLPIFVLFLLLCESVHSQDILNPSLMYPAVNPAFAASYLGIDRAGITLTNNKNGNFHINKSIEKLYSSIGLAASRSVSGQIMVSPLFASHTLLSSKLIHCSVGIQPQYFNQNGRDLWAIKSGILFSSPIDGKWMLGLSGQWQLGDHSIWRPQGKYGLQMGFLIARLTRNTSLTASSFTSVYTVTGLNIEELNSLNYLNYNFKNTSTGIGMVLTDYNYNKLVIRHNEVWNKIGIGITWARTIGPYASSFKSNEFELSAQYKF